MVKIRFWRKPQEPVRSGRREYRQVAISPEAHARLIAKADKRGETIIDTVDKIMGVK